MTTHLKCNSKDIRGHARQLGLAVMLMLQDKTYSEMQVLCLKVWTEQAILHNQIRFFFNDLGAPVGYGTWAYLSDEVEKKLMEQGDCLLHPSEWNEGDRLWILDLCSPEGHTADIVRHLKTNLFGRAREAKWIRHGKSTTKGRVRLFRRRLSSYALTGGSDIGRASRHAAGK